MKGLHKFPIMAVILSAVLVVSGCVVYPANTDAGYGPASRAPAHGYRYNHQGHDVVYDSSLGVYVVVGMQDYYLYDNNYYKYDHDRWYYSRDIDRGWRDYNENRLPPGLAKKYARRNDDRRDHNYDRGDNDHDRSERNYR